MSVLSELEKVKMLFQLRAITAAMGLPQPTTIDNREDNTGLDDGPYLPGCKPRKKPEPKDPAELTKIRANAWETRRKAYGKKGHK